MKRGYSIVALYNAKSPANLGGAMRAAHCFGAAAIYLVGDRFPPIHRLPADTTKAYRHTPCLQVTAIHDVIPSSAELVVVELVDKAEPLTRFCHPERAVYLFGPEDGSVPDDLVALADRVVMIPTRHCLNLAATVNVVLYDRESKAERRSLAVAA